MVGIGYKLTFISIFFILLCQVILYPIEKVFNHNKRIKINKKTAILRNIKDSEDVTTRWLGLGALNCPEVRSRGWQ